MQLSYNKLKTFGDCALRYRFQYVERRPTAPIRSLAFHRRIHAALADYHRLASRDGVVRIEDLLAAHARQAGADTSPEVRASREFAEGEAILRRFCAVEEARSRVAAYVEHPLRVAFGPHILSGKVDRLDFAADGGYALIDYKLDRELPAGNSAEGSPQLSFYHLLVFEALGRAPDQVALFYLRHGVEHVAEPGAASLTATAAWITDTASRIARERDWRPCEGDACRTCSYRAICPARTGERPPRAGVYLQGELPGLDL